jgi:hypothetical protein
MECCLVACVSPQIRMRAPNNDPLVPMHFDKVVEVVEVVEVAKHQKSKGGGYHFRCFASAFNVGYLNQLGSGIPGVAKTAPAVHEVVSSPGTSYLDNLATTPELLSAIEAASVAPVAAAAAPAVGDYLGHLAFDNSIHGAGLTTHADTLATNAAPTGSGAAFDGYLGALPANNAAISGAGIQSFTDILLSNTYIKTTGAPVVATPVHIAAAPVPIAAAPVAHLPHL